MEELPFLYRANNNSFGVITTLYRVKYNSVLSEMVLELSHLMLNGVKFQLVELKVNSKWSKNDSEILTL